MSVGFTPIVQVDVFASEAYTGAPAAVCIIDRMPTANWMQRVAVEMACPNTAFAAPGDDGDGYALRWFTGGGVEVALCGHATLATAHILYEQGLRAGDQPVRFETQSGELSARKRSDGAIEMSFPAEVTQQVETPPSQITDAFGAIAIWIGRNRLDYVIEVQSEDALRALEPDLVALGEIDTRGFVLTARADEAKTGDYDYVLRFFAPRVGVAEDMVTGTAHCALAPYWRDKLGGRNQFVAYQASPRGGFVEARIDGDRVLIAGRAITVMRGELLA